MEAEQQGNVFFALTLSFSLPSPNLSTKTLGKNKSGHVYRQFHFTCSLGRLGCDQGSTGLIVTRSVLDSVNFVLRGLTDSKHWRSTFAGTQANFSSVTYALGSSLW